MRKPIIAGNWKMNMTQTESIALINDLLERDLSKDVDVLVCVPFTSIPKLGELVSGTGICLGAQNVYFEESGAYTGEVSATMLKDLGVEYTIVGHSERRHLFNESNDDINKKIQKLLEKDIKPILCVGETFEERNNEKHFDKVKKQVEECLANIEANDISKLVIAYEPIWAIGTGKSASSDDAEEMCKFIRSCLADMVGNEIADEVRIQYGGSVKPSTIDDLMSKANVDGALVGGASLKGEDFSRIVNYEV